MRVFLLPLKLLLPSYCIAIEIAIAIDFFYLKKVLTFLTP